MVKVVTTEWNSIHNSPGVFVLYEIWWKSSPIPTNTTLLYGNIPPKYLRFITTSESS